MTIENENKETEEIVVREINILKDFTGTFNYAIQLVESGQLKESIEVLEQLENCFELENMVVKALHFARNNVEESDDAVGLEEELTEDSLEKRLLKLNPDAKFIKGKRKSKKVSILSKISNYFDQEQK